MVLIKRLIMLSIAMLIILVGCSPKESEKEFPKIPDIRGRVMEINLQSKTFYAEGEIEEGISYDKAFIRVNEDTVIYIFEKEQGDIGVFSMIKEGDLIEVWFDGPVAESYPVQASAGKIFIYKQQI